jgi:hypothetical protein
LNFINEGFTVKLHCQVAASHGIVWQTECKTTGW